MGKGWGGGDAGRWATVAASRGAARCGRLRAVRSPNPLTERRQQLSDPQKAGGGLSAYRWDEERAICPETPPGWRQSWE